MNKRKAYFPIGLIAIVVVNWQTYGINRYGSNIIQTTTYPSLFQALITLSIILGTVAVALILIRKPKCAVAILVYWVRLKGAKGSPPAPSPTQP